MTENRPATQEETIAFMRQIVKECGADPDAFYYYIGKDGSATAFTYQLSQEDAELIYNESNGIPYPFPDSTPTE